MRAVALLSLCVIFSLSLAGPASALETAAKQAIVVDFETGAVLYDKSAFDPMYPASMTKMMTAYILFKDLKAGKVKLEDTFYISEEAWKMQGSKMFVELGAQIPIGDLLKGIVIQSGNDACVAVAEGLAGSQAAFAERMNAEAKLLGMNSSHFMNPDGWPDPAHVTSAHDLALLAERTIRDFPEYYAVYSEPEFTYHGIRQYNRNLLLGRGLGVDGLKTGHTEISGYGITVSGVQNGRRLIVVVNGLSSEKERAEEAASLLQYGFSAFSKETIVKTGQEVATIPVAMGEEETVPVVAAADASIVIAKAGRENTQFTLRSNQPVAAPIKQGDPIAELIVKPDGLKEQVIPLVAGKDVPKAGFLRRAMLNLQQLFGG